MAIPNTRKDFTKPIADHHYHCKDDNQSESKQASKDIFVFSVSVGNKQVLSRKVLESTERGCTESGRGDSLEHLASCP
jgi:hypothetical protein